MLNEAVKKSIKNLNPLENPLTIYESIEKTLNHITESEQSVLAAKCEILCTGISSTTSSPWTALFVILRQKISAYKNLVEFLISTLLQRAHTSQELESKNIENLLGNMRENWILLGSYVDQYLKENHLPVASFLTKLSATPYEGSSSEARIYFSNNALKTITRFDPSTGGPSRILHNDNLRPIRKLIELSKRKVVHLYAEPTNDDKSKFAITQLVQLHEGYCDDTTESDTTKKTPTDIYVKFSGFMHWSVVCGVKEVFSYYHGYYLLNSSPYDTKYKADIANLQNIDDSTKNLIENLVKVLKKQRHGTSVVLSDFANDIKEYIDNSCEKNYGIMLCSNKDIIKYDPIKGWDLDEGLLLSLTDIDGALFINFQEKCLVTIGTLVYGDIKVEGNTGRGSRYNSIFNYVKPKEDGIYIGIVVSEDGMIDIFQNDASKTNSGTTKAGT